MTEAERAKKLHNVAKALEHVANEFTECGELEAAARAKKFGEDAYMLARDAEPTKDIALPAKKSV